MLKNRILLYILFASALVTSCAKRGAITGGAKDTIPPFIISSMPENMATKFKGNEIRINFNEYIKIKDVNKQLIISPPMEYPPDIMPMGSASKFINIKIKDTLKENTTYSFNFGQSITDNNEGNPYSQFKFIFSTGTYIDSLTLNGKIKDAYTKETDNFVSVMLYEANETFNDSTIYKERPRYVTNTLDSTVQFSLQNLKQGKYHLIALKDQGNNYKFDPKSDKIAFLNQTIDVPNDTIYQLELFQQKKTFRAIRPIQASSNRLYAGYEGDYRGMKIEVKNGAGTETIRTLTTKVKDKDSLQVWLPRKIEEDSLKITVTHRDSIRNFTTKFKEMKATDSLSVDAMQKGGLHFREKFTLLPSTPIVRIDSTKISLMNKDSVAVKYTYAYDDLKQELVFDFEKKEEQKYTFTLMPGALTDFYEKENDTLTYKLATKTYTDYGNLRLTMANVKHFPFMLEVLRKGGKEVAAFYYSESETNINFDNLLPDKYTLRVYYDDNKNKEWDTGDYMLKRQPEEVIYFPKEIDVRANWDPEETFDISGGG
ncbi:Ig-like domain-containing protein [Flavobacterium sp. DG1-102-2]|uniref:Ig-like domain-containing protein n=1 Tax=Flavobacterium sp. DG1-102-2 TaxID=3081663 RepID=UPI002949A1B2|nr:Ig-like domain-containing protein [Flavobacterium sp. DG1-102-2]MDV6169661.1 Ig-like domain-containing protein [Flavobacterium sp. DG1-102-2]